MAQKILQGLCPLHPPVRKSIQNSKLIPNGSKNFRGGLCPPAPPPLEKTLGIPN